MRGIRRRGALHRGPTRLARPHSHDCELLYTSQASGERGWDRSAPLYVPSRARWPARQHQVVRNPKEPIEFEQVLSHGSPELGRHLHACDGGHRPAPSALPLLPLWSQRPEFQPSPVLGPDSLPDARSLAQQDHRRLRRRRERPGDMVGLRRRAAGDSDKLVDALVKIAGMTTRPLDGLRVRGGTSSRLRGDGCLRRAWLSCTRYHAIRGSPLWRTTDGHTLEERMVGSTRHQVPMTHQHGRT
jgi:hypothetical protein